MGALMEHLAIITFLLDVKAADTRQLMQRDALRNHLAHIVVDQQFLPLRPPLAPPLFPHGRGSQPTMSAPRAGPAARGGSRLTIDPIVFGRADGEAADLDKDFINMSMTMNVLVMGLHT
jgi:hypothetical protein